MISVCLATYNGASFLKQQINSILSQLSDTDELIISDDGSKDETIQLIRNFQDKRIKLLHNCTKQDCKKKVDINYKRKRCISNFENALRNAKGDIVFLSDQDDIWYNGKVEKALNTLNTYDLIVSDCKIIDEENNVLLESRFKERNPRLGFFNSLYKNPYLGCCMAFRSSVLKKALPFPSYIPMHDIWLGMVAQAYFHPVLLDKTLVGYRRHSNNINNRKSNYSTNQKQKQNLYPFWKQITFRLNIIRGLVQILFR